MLCCRGEFLLMADADGATQISDLDEMIARINSIKKQGHGIAVGSRAHLEERAVSTVRFSLGSYEIDLLWLEKVVQKYCNARIPSSCIYFCGANC
jgi:hypothetical protein